jgi:hypothetical protein
MFSVCVAGARAHMCVSACLFLPLSLRPQRSLGERRVVCFVSFFPCLSCFLLHDLGFRGPLEGRKSSGTVPVPCKEAAAAPDCVFFRARAVCKEKGRAVGGGGEGGGGGGSSRPLLLRPSSFLALFGVCLALSAGRPPGLSVRRRRMFGEYMDERVGGASLYFGRGGDRGGGRARALAGGRGKKKGREGARERGRGGMISPLFLGSQGVQSSLAAGPE